jgi:hypothetical protein
MCSTLLDYAGWIWHNDVCESDRVEFQRQWPTSMWRYDHE